MRTAPNSAPAAPSGSDPLAELARLIGQNDPFAEFGRQNARQPVQQQPAQPVLPAPVYADDGYASAPALDQAPQRFAADNRQFDNFPQQYGAAPPNFPSRGPVPEFPPESSFGQDAEYPAEAHSGADDHDFYDDVPPRRRLGIVAIAAVLGLIVVGTAGAFGYRALFGSSGAKSPPPVIKAESSPTKIVPAAQSKDPKSGKLIYDRVAERGQDEKLVSREEQPLDRPPGAANAPGQAAGPAPMGSGIVATEPKKVHTIAIRPDGTAMADAAPTQAVASAPSPPMAAPTPPPARPVATEPQSQPRPQPVAHTEPPTRRTVAAAPSGGPLSLSPDAPGPAPAPAAPRPARTAVAAPTQTAPVKAAAPASGGGGGYAVQLSSQRSEAEAQTAFRSLQAKYPSQLGGKQPLIRQVDLGAKGVYYRAMVGPMASEDASQLCSGLKAAGGQCIIQRN
jgi:hypothetical protein